MTSAHPRRVVAFSGGVGGARFLRGLLAAAPDAEVTAVVNTGDDITLHGLRVCPDLDTVLYTLGGAIDDEKGWGRADEHWLVGEELATYAGAAPWFGLGDRDLATHLLRTGLLADGHSLTAVVEQLARRWQPGARILPMSDDRVETHVTLVTGETVHFQEWWVRLHAGVAARAIVAVGAEEAEPAPGVLDAIADADVVLLPPSNPVVSIGTILAVPGIRAALGKASAPIVGVSPIIGGAPVRGFADACLSAIGVETSAAAVAGHYAPRGDGGLLDGWLVDDADADAVAEVEAGGIPCRSRPLLMTDVGAAAEIAAAALAMAAEVRR